MIQIGMKINGYVLVGVVPAQDGAVILARARVMSGGASYAVGRVFQRDIDSPEPVREWAHGTYFHASDPFAERKALQSLLERAGVLEAVGG